MAFIRENLTAFLERLVELLEGIHAWESLNKEQPGGKKTESPETDESAIVLSLLHRLSTALESKIAIDIDRILEELNKKNPDEKTKEALEQISDDVLMAEYGKAGEILDGLLDAIR